MEDFAGITHITVHKLDKVSMKSTCKVVKRVKHGAIQREKIARCCSVNLERRKERAVSMNMLSR